MHDRKVSGISGRETEKRSRWGEKEREREKLHVQEVR